MILCVLSFVVKNNLIRSDTLLYCGEIRKTSQYVNGF